MEPATKSPVRHRPPAIEGIDQLIGELGGDTLALSTSPGRLQAMKDKNGAQTQQQHIEQLTKENGHLRAELDHYKAVAGELTKFLGIYKRMQPDLEMCQREIYNLNEEFRQLVER